MAQDIAVELDEDELIALYFDIDRASCPSDIDSSNGSPENPNPNDTFDQDIVSFTPNYNHEEREHISEPGPNMGRKNFSGGRGCYAWQGSPYVMMGSEGPPFTEILDTFGIRWEDWFKMQGNTGYIENEYRFPSEYAGIDWAALIRECYELPR
ncbi:uncharacterized protein F4812DRAFT_463762 [Daldinia caldariorum]|uniref:uncharacterized protein n=1 Tax=Daldinia caldariorum TaxID=326644 RepID=UPI0020076FBE|nr:uncharacterized protein F4812DRAFT_463762 [Daldinia caldariorum]KAI1463427.1 hypothetical protein F4812DRAFT_463762 [Daldinia caldariorum]